LQGEGVLQAGRLAKGKAPVTSSNCATCGGPLQQGFFGGVGECSRCNEPRIRPGDGAGWQSLLAAPLLASVCTIAFYSLGPFLLLRDTHLYHLFCGHGWIPYALVVMFFCGFAILILKLPALSREFSAFDLQLLPEETDRVIEAADAQKILSRIGRLAPRQRSLLLVLRIRQALLRLNQLGTAEKLDDLLRYRADADIAAIDSSYAAPKFIIWAIPVLGFVGTVLGISNGVQAFSTLIQNAADIEGLRESLKGVTYGLGQAFETTMLALCMSLILMFVMSLIQRREDRLLACLDDYCMENLLHRIRTHNQEIVGLTRAVRELVERLQPVPTATPRDGSSASQKSAGSGVK
jgi:biopolymer transport protein ExbB/TolQ